MTIELSAANPPKLVIFDCDGVLVDSEPLIESAFIRVLEGFGLQLGPDAYRTTFRGLSNSRIAEVVRSRWGVSLPEEFGPVIESEEWDAMERDLQAVPGAADAVRSVVASGMAVCVASNGSPEALVQRLKLTGLYDWFAGRLFSSTHLARPKPHPDVFLHAAESMGFSPGECVVIEDSDPGVAAGLAAGMRVLAFVPNPDESDEGSTRAERFTDMASLPPLLGLSGPAQMQ